MTRLSSNRTLFSPPSLVEKWRANRNVHMEVRADSQATTSGLHANEMLPPPYLWLHPLYLRSQFRRHPGCFAAFGAPRSSETGVPCRAFWISSRSYWWVASSITMLLGHCSRQLVVDVRRSVWLTSTRRTDRPGREPRRAPAVRTWPIPPRLVSPAHTGPCNFNPVP